MSVVVKEKEINYNESSHYRANPYANQGYIPSNALKNRKQPQFYSQIPQGIEYFDNSSSKKHFTNIAIRSQISQENLISNPERYPLENTLANDINYLRNLSTIDIQGANANSKKSLGVRYRIKAQEDLMRRNAKIITPILYSGTSQEEQRRRLAMQQLERVNSRESSLKSFKRNYNSEKKLPPPQFYKRNPYVERKDQGMQFDLNDELEKAIANHGLKEKEEEKRSEPQSFDLFPKTYDNRMPQDYTYDRSQVKSNGSMVSLGSSQHLTPEPVHPEIKLMFEREKQNIEKDLIKKQIKHQLRLLNPTNLSYEGSIVRNSGILAGLGKNIAIGGTSQ